MNFIARLLNIFGTSMVVAGLIYLFVTELQLQGSGVLVVVALAALGVISLAAGGLMSERLGRGARTALIWGGSMLFVLALLAGFALAGPSQRGLNKANLIGTVLLVATGVFCYFISLMIRAAPAMEYMVEHPEAKIDRTVDYSADKTSLALPPPPKGVHIPGPSVWPVLIAGSAALIAAGLVFHVQINGLVVAGVLLAVITGGGWFRQGQRERQEIIEHEEEHAAH